MTERAKAIEELLRSQRSWMLCLVGDDQFSQLGRLMSDLRSAPSTAGDGKKVDSGFSYWGIGPTRAWERACTDPAYVVMKESILSFPHRWSKVKGKLLTKDRIHYVSLGVGTGQKDEHILQELAKAGSDLCYFATDMSAEMLRYSVSASMAELRRGNYLVYAVQIDFSSSRNLSELKQLVSRNVGDDPVLYSILGNTIANFNNDICVLKNIARLLRPQDRLLLEVAFANVADENTAELAAEEYRRSELFKQFVTSALLHNTDLSIDLNRVEILPDVEKDHAIVLKVIYKSTPSGERFTLPDRFEVNFPPGDTIRVYLTRKYTEAGIAKLVKESGCYTHTEHRHQNEGEDFGIALHLMGPQSGSVFVSFSTNDRPFVERLRKSLLANGIDPYIDFDDGRIDVKLYDGIQTAVRTADKLLLIFSDSSKDREWVKTEVRLAFKELDPNPQKKLHVLLLTPVAELQRWQCLGDSGEDLGRKLLEYPQSDFLGWREWPDSLFEERVSRLARGLASA